MTIKAYKLKINRRVIFYTQQVVGSWSDSRIRHLFAEQASGLRQMSDTSIEPADSFRRPRFVFCIQAYEKHVNRLL